MYSVYNNIIIVAVDTARRNSTSAFGRSLFSACSADVGSLH